MLIAPWPKSQNFEINLKIKINFNPIQVRIAQNDRTSKIFNYFNNLGGKEYHSKPKILNGFEVDFDFEMEC